MTEEARTVMRTRHSLSIILAVVSLAASLFGQFAYVVNRVSNNITEFKINESTGMLTGNGSIRTGNLPTSIAVDPNGKFAYVTNSGDNNVSAYRIAANGTLTQIGSPIASQPFPFSVAVDGSGRYVYVATNNGSVNGTGSAYSINPNGSLANNGTFPEQLSSDSVAVSHSRKYVYVANRQSANVSGFSINPNGTLTQLPGSPYAVLLEPSSMYSPPIGVDCLYVANFGSNKVSGYFLGVSGGGLEMKYRTDESPYPTDSEPQSIAVRRPPRPVTTFGYVANFGANDVSAYTVNTKCEWTVTSPPSFATGPAPTAVVVDPQGRFVYVVTSGNNSVWGYKILGKGTLQALPGGHFDTGTDPVAIAVR